MNGSDLAVALPSTFRARVAMAGYLFNCGKRALFTSGALLAVLFICAGRPASASDAPPRVRPDANLLAFLDGEHVTRTDVVARLGAPRASFERGHVTAYRLGQNKDGYFVVPAPKKKTPEFDWRGVDYDLMLLFDDDDLLRQHNLIGVRSPSNAP